jgi:hypothetical protein
MTRVHSCFHSDIMMPALVITSLVVFSMPCTFQCVHFSDMIGNEFFVCLLFFFSLFFLCCNNNYNRDMLASWQPFYNMWKRVAATTSIAGNFFFFFIQAVCQIPRLSKAACWEVSMILTCMFSPSGNNSALVLFGPVLEHVGWDGIINNEWQGKSLFYRRIKFLSEFPKS